MSSNSVQIIHQLHRHFQELVEYVTGKESRSRTAYEVELTLFRGLLALGAQLLHLFFVQRATVRPSEPVYAADGTRLKYHDLRQTTSVFDSLEGNGGNPTKVLTSDLPIVLNGLAWLVTILLAICLE